MARFDIFIEGFRLSRNGKSASLRPSVAYLLILFLSTYPRSLNADEILIIMSSMKFSIGAKRRDNDFVTRNTFYVQLCRLRRAIRPFGMNIECLGYNTYSLEISDASTTS